VLLPTVVGLAAEHEVSAGAVNRAVALLKAEGLIDVQRGKHAVVTSEKDRKSR
jgi:DNA-binding transcriptional regulator YhcF (GntR family)